MTAAIRQRLAAALSRELRILAQTEHAERVAVDIDRGLGVSAIAAIAATPRGPGRAVEARRWVRRANAQGVDRIAVLFVPGMSEDEVDAATELHVALSEAA